MASREELLALLVARRRGLSIRPQAPGHSPSWQGWLDTAVPVAAGPTLSPDALADEMANVPIRQVPSGTASTSGWGRFRSLFRQGWGRERDESPMLRRGAFAASLFYHLLAALLLAWLTWLSLTALNAPGEEETVRVRITGFGSPDAAGGGDAPADGDLQPAATAEAAASAAGRPAAAASSSPPATQNNPTAIPESIDAQAMAEQPLQVSEPTPAPAPFQLPPPRQAAVAPQPVPELQTQAIPEESAIPTALPQVRSLDVPSDNREVQVADLSTRERTLPTVPDPMPAVTVREIAVRPGSPALQAPEAATRPLPTRGQSDATAPAAATASGATRPAADPRPGLPGARGISPRPGQQSTASGAGPAARTADSGWPSPRKGDDWGLGERSRAGAATGGDRGNPRGQGGSGLFDADGRPRLADDSFKPRFPDPYKEGTWLKRPSLGYRGTIFDGIWRPPETLLQEWIRKGVKSFDIPLPGGKVKIRCVVSLLQAGGGCGPVAGKEGVHDQPAVARPAPDIPFKPELFENQDDLTRPAKTESGDGSP